LAALLAGCPNPPPVVAPHGCVSSPRAHATCAGDVNEPNDDLVQAVAPKSGAACSSPGQSGAIADRNDADVYRTGACSLSSTDPSASIKQDGLRLCLFFACTIGATDVYGCYENQPGDSLGKDGKPQPMRTAAGFLGCCRAGHGSVKAQVTCHNLQQKAQAFIWIDSGETDVTCAKYDVTYQVN
jgi:hypothetical protein